jgi:hypothetical protein
LASGRPTPEVGVESAATSREINELLPTASSGAAASASSVLSRHPQIDD